MNIYPEWTEICTCHNCGTRLHYRPGTHNIFSGGPFDCGRCGADVTEDIYGKPKSKEQQPEPQK